MGNSVQKKKKLQAEKNFSVPVFPSPKREKTKGFWLLGHQDKVKTGLRLFQPKPTTGFTNARRGSLTLDTASKDAKQTSS
ncbi:hypothetical protein JOQ06_016275 [Pogonophryne albipinna]|uniref:Uncharacterized protein n=1 Tax=Pogonophryne albipinna TaxID=1090488 RepID=A0AAD6FCD0_9TELE|nr:hypothetical protein JOQ06_016275 [Pogonophryne albipinna]